MSDTDLQSTVQFVKDYFRLHPNSDVEAAAREASRVCVRGLSSAQIENIKKSVLQTQTPLEDEAVASTRPSWAGVVPAFIRHKDGTTEPLQYQAAPVEPEPTPVATPIRAVIKTRKPREIGLNKAIVILARSLRASGNRKITLELSHDGEGITFTTYK